MRTGNMLHLFKEQLVRRKTFEGGTRGGEIRDEFKPQACDRHNLNLPKLGDKSHRCFDACGLCAR